MTTQLDTEGATALGLVAQMMASHRIHCVVVWGDAEPDAEGGWGVVSDLDLVGVAASEDIAFRTAGGSARTPSATRSTRSACCRRSTSPPTSPAHGCRSNKARDEGRRRHDQGL